MQKEIKEKAEQFIIMDQMEKAFELIKPYIHEEEHHRDLFSYWGQLTQFEADRLRGLLTYEEYSVHKNRIRQSLLKLIRDIFLSEKADIQRINNLMKLGLAAMEELRFDEALSHFEAVLTVMPGHPQASMEKGVVFLSTGQFSDALVEFTRVLEKEPTNHFALHNRGVAYYQLGNQEKACEEWKKVKKLEFPISNELLLKYCM